MKSERFDFQLVVRFFFSLCRFKSALELLEVPYNLQIIVFRQTELVNFGDQCRDGTGEGLECCSFPVFLAIVVASSTMALSNMATLDAIEPYRVILVRGESIVFMLLKEYVIHCSI
jgi:hypothetical protein